MRLFPKSFNGFQFQQGQRVVSSFDDFDWNIGGISTNNIARNQNRPKYSGKIYTGGVKVVNVTLNDVDADKDSLVIAMDVSGDQQHPLYALDEFGKTWYVNAVCTGLNTESTSEKTGQFGYIFECDDPTWTAVTEDSETWHITADGDTHTINVGGNQIARPVLEITPGAPAGYYPYKQYIKNYNPIAYAQTDSIDITGSGWDTAALIGAGKMLATGDDLRVVMDGVQIPRWFGGGGINSATTKVFIRQRWLPGRSMPLKTAIAASGTPTHIEWAVTAAVKAALKKLPRRGMIRVGTEEISYKNLSPALCRASIERRAIRGTSMAAHAAGDVCWWVEHDIKVIYGNSSAAAPSYSDLFKPVFNMTSSTLASRVYAEFADARGLRAGSFKSQVINDGLGKESRVYSGNQAAEAEVDPATDMGMEIASYEVQGRPRPESAELAWEFYHPAGIASVTTSGEKYKSFANSTWPKIAGLESSKDGITWVQEWNEAAPGNPATWDPLTNTSLENLPAGTKYIRFRLKGSVNGLLNNYARLEIDSLTLALTSANVIQVGMNGEISSYHFTIEIHNGATDESIFLDYPVSQGETLIIDTDAMEVTYKGMNVIKAISLDSIRTEWLKFIRGDNILQYIASPTGDVDIVIKKHNRAL